MKTGIFISRDLGEISDSVDVNHIADSYLHHHVTQIYESFFLYEDQQQILETIDSNSLDGVVFAGNSPKYFDRVFNGDYILRELRNRGINENRIAFANIKEQSALPHKGDIKAATEKAGLLIDVALAKLELCHDIKMATVSPLRTVIVIGTSPGGLIATKLLIDKGYRVFLIDRNETIQKHDDISEDLTPTVTAIRSDKKVHLVLGSTVKDISGWCGDYKVILSTKNGEVEIPAGGVILCPGDNLDWISELRPQMQLDTYKNGHLRGIRKRSMIGRTRDPGVWFIPFRKDEDRYTSEAGGASNAVLALTTILDRNEISHPILITEIDETVCGGCGTCVKTCAFSASHIDPVKKVSVIDPKRCKGCGNCVVACPTGARDLINFPEHFIVKAIDILSRGVSTSSDPKVLAILCNSCGYPAADEAGELSDRMPGLRYSPNVLPVMVECGGNVDTQYILRAFKKGFDGVAISICKDGHCHHIVGNTDMERRVGLFREVLRSRRINDERLRIIHVFPDDGEFFSNEMNSFIEELKTMDKA